MGNIPNSCVTCPYESSCNTAMDFTDCRFYYARKNKPTIMAQLKKIFGKIFK